MEGFQIGQNIGKAKRSTFSRSSEGVLDQFNKTQEMRAKFAGELGLESAKNQLPPSAKDQASIDASKSTISLNKAKEKDLINNPGGRRRTLTPEDLADRRKMLGMPPDAAGRLESSLEGVRALRHMKKLLFPDGTPESFQRQIAMKKNVFGGLPNDYESRTLYRRAGQAIAGKLLVQSGVSTRPDEYEKIGRQMVASAFSNPREAFEALNEGENFYTGFVNDVDPSKLFHSDEEMNPEPYKNTLQKTTGNQNNEIDSRNEINKMIASGEYEQDVIDQMKKDFQEEYGKQF